MNTDDGANSVGDDGANVASRRRRAALENRLRRAARQQGLVLNRERNGDGYVLANRSTQHSERHLSLAAAVARLL